MSTGQFGYGGVPGYCVDPVSGYQMLSSYFHVSQVSRQTYIKTIQPRPFEEWIKKGHQRDANLCGAYARPTDERSLVRGGKECEVLTAHGAGSSEHADEQILRCHAPVVGFATARTL